MQARSKIMTKRSGNTINLKFTANDIDPDICKRADSAPVSGTASKTGRKAVTNIMIMTIIINAIIRYLNFNLNTPELTNCRNDKIKILLRQRYEAAGFLKAWGNG